MTEKKTKIVCISDTHIKHAELVIPECDILLHSGDATFQGQPHRIREFGKWFSKQPAKHKIFVAGNHDLLFEDDPVQAEDLLNEEAESGIITLNQESVTINGLNIYGEPRQPWFYDWAFNVKRPNMKQVWDKVPAHTDILVTHGPPLDHGDRTVRGEPVGCKYQKQLIESMDNLKLVVCGHIHNGYGLYNLNNAIVANASVCNERYNVTNAPLVVYL